MKPCLLIGALLISGCAFAQGPKPCEELKSEITKKLETNGVKTFSLDIVDKDAQAEGKVVGTCEGGTKKIVYRKGAPASQKPSPEPSKAER